MTALSLILPFLALGSFTNNVISFFTGVSSFDVKRSRCMCSERTLKFRELMPVLSFIIQKGKCTSCSKPLPVRYIVVEIGALTVGLLSYLVYGITLNMALHYFMFMVLLTIGVVDLKKLIIPNFLIIMLLFIAAVKVMVFNSSFMINAASAFSLGLIFISLNLISSKLKRKTLIGAGDIKLIIVMTLLMDFPLPLAGLWLSAFIGIPGYYLLRHFSKEQGLNRVVPFGFFMSLGYTFTELSGGFIYKYLIKFFFSCQALLS